MEKMRTTGSHRGLSSTEAPFSDALTYVKLKHKASQYIWLNSEFEHSLYFKRLSQNKTTKQLTSTSMCAHLRNIVELSLGDCVWFFQGPWVGKSIPEVAEMESGPFQRRSLLARLMLLTTSMFLPTMPVIFQSTKWSFLLVDWKSLFGD